MIQAFTSQHSGVYGRGDRWLISQQAPNIVDKTQTAHMHSADVGSKHQPSIQNT